MKQIKYIIPLLAAGMLLASCDDQIMEWGRPAGEQEVTLSDIPLGVKEALANYPTLNEVAKEYQPNFVLGLGMGADLYTSNYHGNFQELANENFQMFTMGNAMKMDAIVTSSGALNFKTMDAMLEVMPEGQLLYGHNFIWHTQQAQSYLKSLIAPTMVIKTDGDIANLLSGDASDFNGGTNGGWSSWGSGKKSGEVADGSMVLENVGDGNFWEAQFAYTFSTPLEKGKEYVIRFKAKSSSASGQLQFQYQNSTTYGSQGGYTTFNVGTDWTTCEKTFTITDYDDVDRILINFGQIGGRYSIDDIQFGTKVEDRMTNILAGDASDFEGGTSGSWSSWGSGKKSGDVTEGSGKDGSYGMVLSNVGDGNAWDAQFAYTFGEPLDNTKKYIIQFWAKSSSASGQLQFQYQNGTSYGSQGGYNTFNVGSEWAEYEYEFTPGYDDVDRIILNFGAVGGTYNIDNIKFGIAKDQNTTGGAKKFIPKRRVKGLGYTTATTITYTPKTADEKRTALLGAMDMWIKGMADHLKDKGVTPYGYDVINEPIEDGNNKLRGIEVFNGEDREPTETTADGLNLNWGDNRFYWGYYVKDYAVQAFQKARKYLPASTKLFVNDYNLEISPSKLNALIKFINDIDKANGSPIVDGIGTQVHFDLKAATDDWASDLILIEELRSKVDAMFQTLASSGKMIRVTELDVALGTSSPSAAQYRTQAEAYRMIIESYLKNIPAAQQSGLTIWSLSDNAVEHEYWLNGDVPNIFDADFLRKWAYKGVADGLAGKDLGTQYGGDAYKAYYEKNNVSGSVTE
jgi:endo-1,4-beta-xylanase